MLPFLGRLSLLPTGVGPGDKRTADEMAEDEDASEEELDGGVSMPPPPSQLPGVLARSTPVLDSNAITRVPSDIERDRETMKNLFMTAGVHARTAGNQTNGRLTEQKAEKAREQAELAKEVAKKAREQVALAKERAKKAREQVPLAKEAAKKAREKATLAREEAERLKKLAAETRPTWLPEDADYVLKNSEQKRAEEAEDLAEQAERVAQSAGNLASQAEENLKLAEKFVGEAEEAASATEDVAGGAEGAAAEAEWNWEERKKAAAQTGEEPPTAMPPGQMGFIHKSSSEREGVIDQGDSFVRRKDETTAEADERKHNEADTRSENIYHIKDYELRPFDDYLMRAFDEHGAEEDVEEDTNEGDTTNIFDEGAGDDSSDEEEEGEEKKEEKKETEEEDDSDDPDAEEKAAQKKEEEAKDAARAAKKPRSNPPTPTPQDSEEDKEEEQAALQKQAELRDLARRANMRYWQVLCWLEKLTKEEGNLPDEFGIALTRDELKMAELRVRAACVQWAREGGGGEKQGKVSKWGNPILWAIVIFLQTIAERNDPPRVVVRDREDVLKTYRAKTLVTLEELYKFLYQFKGDDCQDKAQLNANATRVAGNSDAANAARQTGRLPTRRLRYDSLGSRDAQEKKVMFVHNLLRRSEVANGAEREHRRVLDAARAEARRQARREWQEQTRLYGPQLQTVEEAELAAAKSVDTDEKAQKKARDAALKELEDEWEKAMGLAEPVRELQPPEVAPEYVPERDTQRNRPRETVLARPSAGAPRALTENRRRSSVGRRDELTPGRVVSRMTDAEAKEQLEALKIINRQAAERASEEAEKKMKDMGEVKEKKKGTTRLSAAEKREVIKRTPANKVAALMRKWNLERLADAANAADKALTEARKNAKPAATDVQVANRRLTAAQNAINSAQARLDAANATVTKKGNELKKAKPYEQRRKAMELDTAEGRAKAAKETRENPDLKSELEAATAQLARAEEVAAERARAVASAEQALAAAREAERRAKG